MIKGLTHVAISVTDIERSIDFYERAGRLFGRKPLERAAGLATIALAALWKLRIKIFGDQLQPKTIVTRLSKTAVSGKHANSKAKLPVGRSDQQQLPTAAAAFSPTAVLTAGRSVQR